MNMKKDDISVRNNEVRRMRAQQQQQRKKANYPLSLTSLALSCAEQDAMGILEDVPIERRYVRVDCPNL